MPGFPTEVCLNTSTQSLYTVFHSTSMPKLTTGYNTIMQKTTV